MDNPLIIFRIGYMESYDGPGPIQGGGAYVKEYGEGTEMWNFGAEDGRCFGYVMTNNHCGIDLSRISHFRRWTQGDLLRGVDIVFIARKPGVGQVIVGWYKNATVFHKEYRRRWPAKRTEGDSYEVTYVCEVKAQNAHLLDEAQRVFSVPRGKGYPGQSNVWYGDKSGAAASHFLFNLRDYISKETISAP
jgi:hypothetical protein